jgi:transcriptional regulator with XRE-family HTH domain
VGIGTRLKWGRERRQLASRAVADQIGLSPEGLTFYERDGSIRSMSVDKADKCARYLGLTFEWFCLGIGEPFLDGEIDGVTYNKEAEYQAIRDTRAAIKRQVEMEGSPGVDTELTRMALGIDREKASIARNRRQRR